MVEIREGLKDIKGSKTNDKEAKDYLNWLLYCLQPALRPKVHIYSLESDYDLDDTIFEAIIQGKQRIFSSIEFCLRPNELARHF